MDAEREETHTVRLFECPLCREWISAEVRIKMWLGFLRIAAEPRANPASVVMQASAPGHTRVESLQVHHECKRKDDDA